MENCLKWFLIIGLIAFAIQYWPILLFVICIYFIYMYIKNTKLRKGRYCDIDFDSMDGHEFEYFCADLLRDNGFYGVRVTQGSGDHGIDIIANKNRMKYAIQCKCYSNKVGNKAVQEAFSGKSIYGADIAVVMTNRYFTKQATSDAWKLDVQLWDRSKIMSFIRSAKGQEEIGRTVDDDKMSVTIPTVDPKIEGSNNTPKHHIMPIEKENINTMYDKEKGIYPAGQYLVGEDIEIGKYLLISRKDKIGSVSIYENYKNYKKDEMITYQSFDEDYYLSLRENGIFVVVENADIQKL